MILAKVHSEAALAAHVYHGWEIVSFHEDQATKAASEHVLRWVLPEAPRSPSSSEIKKFAHLSDVEAKFEINGRGVVIAPGLPRSKAGLIRKETPIVLMDYKGAAFSTQVRDIEMSSPPSPKGWAILLPPEVRSGDVQIGMQVWVRILE